MPDAAAGPGRALEAQGVRERAEKEEIRGSHRRARGRTREDLRHGGRRRHGHRLDVRRRTSRRRQGHHASLRRGHDRAVQGPEDARVQVRL